MSGTEVLIHLLGGVALLLWGLRMVRTGVMRGYGGRLRQWMGRHFQSRLAGFFSGLGATLLLQSSTATTLMTAGFVRREVLAAPIALGVVLGADVGSTLVVQAMSFGISWFAPLFVFAGVVTFLTGGETRRRDLGRALLGLGLTLMSLKLIVAATEPLRESAAILGVLKALAGEPVLALVVGLALTWLAHSSVAVVLLILSMADAGLIGLPSALGLVLGANLGGTLPAVTVTFGTRDAARRVAVGNFAFRLAGCVVGVGFVAPVADFLGGLIADPGRAVATAHTAFNLTIAIVFLPLLGWAAGLLERLLSSDPRGEDPSQPKHLDPESLQAPALALSAAERETLRMGDAVETMLKDSLKVFVGDDRKLVAEVSKRDDVVDRLHEAIKIYLTKLSRETGFQSDEESRRSMEIIAYTTNLEHVGDIIDKNLMELADKKIKNHLRFSQEGLDDIVALHEEVLATLKLSLAVFMSGTPAMARKLLEEKVRFRERERAAADRHFERLRDNRPETIQTSSLHLDVLRDLKRINSHLAAAAYPILEQTGALRESRLVAED
ncbi:MAG: Na/Pi cotransporter family protein [Alphaproteobacteria bacterium]|nr:Na/Pi cotransporter family protein [Alphaproteobacteria bacterium]